MLIKQELTIPYLPHMGGNHQNTGGLLLFYYVLLTIVRIPMYVDFIHFMFVACCQCEDQHWVCPSVLFSPAS
jgi:hypothetical protein